jgi:O-antigen ligase
MTVDAWTSDASSPVAASGDRMVRSALFLATFLLIWVTANPFPDLADPKLLQPASEGNPLGQILTLLLTASLGAFVLLNHGRLVLRAFTPILLVTLAWFALSAGLSPNAELAARRLLLSVLTLFQAAAFLLLPLDRIHFARLLTAGALIILVLCYAGVIFVPDLAIHQSVDVAEPELAGDWRGSFTHKNGAGAAMVLLIFIGIFAIRTFSGALGALVIALAGIFLVFTESKSPTRLLPVVLALSYLIACVHRPGIKLILAAGIPLFLTTITIGSVMFSPIEALVNNLASDPTFTGRSEIWTFALDHIAQRPALGFGFQAFWGSSDLVTAWSYLESWGYRASDAHNAYLNLAVMTGIVGLVLAMLWIFVQPLVDHARTEPSRNDHALTTLFLQIWLFGLCVSSFESTLFDGGNSLWFMMVVAIIGIRYQAIARLAR